MRIIIASDMHIGFEYANTYKINKFFNIVEDDAPDYLILNGDILDLWRNTASAIVKENGDLLRRINEIASVTKTVWIIGNHDFSVPKRYFPNVDFRNSINIGNIHVEHGHRYDMQQVRFGWAYGIISLLYPPIYYWLYRRPNKIIKEDFGSSWLPMHDEAAKCAQKHNVNIIVGHSHCPQIRVLDSGYYVADSGDFIDSSSYIEINDRMPELKRV